MEEGPSHWVPLVDLTNLDQFDGGKVWMEGSFFGDIYTKTKISLLTQLFKDFEIKAVNIEKTRAKTAHTMAYSEI